MREAARTSATYSYYNPHNMHIERNMYFYKSREGVTEEDMVSMETMKYVWHVYVCSSVCV